MDRIDEPVAGESGGDTPEARPSDPIGELLRAAAAHPPGTPERDRLRLAAIEAGLPVARRMALRYQGRGEPPEDLMQVAAVGLIKAVNGFRPDVAAFWPYAKQTIIGELRRHFRDKGWGVRVPRSVQDVWARIRNDGGALAQRLGRSVTSRDLAAALAVDESVIVDAWTAGQSYAPTSLSAPVLDNTVLADYVSVNEDGYDRVENRHALRQAMRALPHRSRHIVMLRFAEEMTQAQIAEAVGLSQMHVSRILADAVASLRNVMSAGDAGPQTPRSAARPYRTHRSPTTPPSPGDCRTSSRSPRPHRPSVPRRSSG